MSFAPMKNDDRRAAERHSPPKPVPATFGGFDVSILEIGLVGCRIAHIDRLPPKTRTALRFAWRGTQVRIDGVVVRSELTSRNGKPAYISGLQFCDSPEQSPPVVRDIVGWLIAQEKKAAPVPEPEPDFDSEPARVSAPPNAPAVTETIDDEPEELSARYLRCTLTGGQWTNIFVDDPTQPPDGFTIVAPANEKEAELLRQAWQQAGAEKRSAMRKKFEQKLKG